MIKYFFLILCSFLFLIENICSGSKSNTEATLQNLLGESEEANGLIISAIEVREKFIKEYPKIQSYSRHLLKEEQEFEFKAYKKYFKIKDNYSLLNQECIKNKINDRWNILINCLKEKLSFEEDKYTQDLNKYHNVCFKINNDKDWESLEKMKIMTDNHSSKLFIQYSKESLFLGDLLGRHLLCFGSDKVEQKKNNQNNILSWMIPEKQNELLDEERIFNFLKYNYFLLRLAILQANYRLKLLNKDLSFSEFKYFYCLGNHDCGVMLMQDFEELKFPVDKFLEELCHKIDAINRFLIPTEIVFILESSQKAFVFSHSGGMTLLPDNVKINSLEHNDFTITQYHYSLRDSSVKKRFNNLQNYDTRYFMSKVLSCMKSFNSNDRIIISNPFIWCDFFTYVSLKNGCKEEGGRYSLMDIRNTNVLECLYNILKVNYGLKDIKYMNIFRGHEHEASKLQQYFSNDTKYTVKSQNDNSYLFFHYLRPIFFDNQYCGYFINASNRPELRSHDIDTIEEFISQKNNVCQVASQQQNDINKDQVNLIPFFFDDVKIYNLCNNVLTILNKIITDLRLNLNGGHVSFDSDKIIDISKDLQSDEEIFMQILREIDKFQNIATMEKFAIELDEEQSNKNEARGKFFLEKLQQFKQKYINNKTKNNGDIKFIEFIKNKLDINDYISYNEKIENLLKECFENENKKNIEYQKILAICIGCIIPLILMNIERSQLISITAGITISIVIFFIDTICIKNISKKLTYLSLLGLPFFCSLVFLIAINENRIDVLKNIFYYIDLKAGIDNYQFFKNMIEK